MILPGNIVLSGSTCIYWI